MTRPTTFDPLVPFDPTPGEVAEVADAAGALTSAGGRTADLAGGLGTFAGGVVAGTGWEGSAAVGYHQTVALLPPITTRVGERLTDAAAALDSWAADLSALQAETDRLHADAVQADADLTACAAELEATTRHLAAAQAALAAMDADDPGQPAAARAVADLAARRHQLWIRHDTLEAHLARLRADAAELHDQHRTALTAVATAIHDAHPQPIELGSFALRAASAAAIHALPHLDLDGGQLDGIIGPEELARALLDVHSDRYTADERADVMADLWPVFLATAAAPAALAQVFQTLGPAGTQRLADTIAADTAADTAAAAPPWLDADGHLVISTPPPPGHVHASPGDPLHLDAAGVQATFTPGPMPDMSWAGELADVFALIGQGAAAVVITLGTGVLIFGSGGAAVGPAIGAASAVGAAAAAGEVVTGVLAGEVDHVAGGAISAILAGPGAIADDVLRAALDAGEIATVRAIISGEIVTTGAGLAVSLLQDDPTEDARAA